MIQIDVKTIRNLINKIDSGLEEVKNRSINSLYSKIFSNILPAKELPQFIQLPSVLMNWINNHQSKSQQLYKTLSILQIISNSEEGLNLLKQYESLEFLEEFRRYFAMHNTNIDNYLEKIEQIIHKLLPFRTTQNQNENQMNNQKQDNNPPEEQPSPQQNIKQAIQSTKRNYFQNVKSLDFTILKNQFSEAQEKYIFDMTVQLKYGNKISQYQTLRKIKQFMSWHPTEQYRNKYQLLNQLCVMLQNNAYANDVAQILQKILQAHIKEQTNLKKWEHKNIKNKPHKLVKCTIPLPQTIFKNYFTQPILKLLTIHFKSEWIQWLCGMKEEWTSPYLIKMLQKVPSNIILQKKQLVSQLINVLAKNEDMYLNYRWISEIIQHDAFKSGQEYQAMKISFSKIYKYQEGKFMPYEYTHVMKKLCEDLKEGILGLAYDISIIKIYVDTMIFLSIAAMKEDPLKEYYYEIQKSVIEISRHPTEQVRIKLYEILLQKAYEQQSIAYFDQNFSVNSLVFLIFLDQLFWIRIFQASLNQIQSTIYMLQICKLLYIHHNKISHTRYIKFGAILNILSDNKDHRLSKLCKNLMDKFSKSEKILIQVMNLFSKDKLVRMSTAQDLINIQDDFVEQFLQKKSNPKLKPLNVDEDSVINYINIAINQQIESSIRISAINQLIGLIQRCEFSAMIINRLQVLNQTILKWLPKIQDQIFFAYLLSLNLSLYIKNIKCRLFNNVENLLSKLKNPSSRLMKQKILEILYLNCFRNPFDNDTNKIHWILLSDRFHHFMELEKVQRNVLNVVPVKKDKKIIQPQVANFKGLQTLLEFIYKNLEGEFKEFEIRFEEIQKLIGKSISLNASDGSVSLLRTLFQLYRQNNQRFKPLSNEFQQIIPLMFNTLNSDNNKYFQLDLIKIIKVISLKNEKHISNLLSHKNLQIKLEISQYATSSMSKSLFENLLKSIPNLNEPLLQQLYVILIKKDYQTIDNQFLQISLISSLQKSIQSKNYYLKLNAMQLVQQILTKKFLEQNSVFINIVLDQITREDATYITLILGLQLTNQIITVDFQSIQRGIHQLKIVNILLELLSRDHLPFLVYTSALSIINNLICLDITEKYQIVDIIVNLFNLKFHENILDPSQFLLMIHEVCASLILLIMKNQQLNNYLLASTDSLVDILHILRKIKNIYSTEKKSSNEEPKFLRNALNSIGNLLFNLSNSQDLFIFHLNKILNQDEFKSQKNIFMYFSDFLKYSGNAYHKMIARLIVIWYKGHLSLDRDNLGAEILVEFLKLEQSQPSLVNCLLAVSNSAKNKYIQLNEFQKFLRSAMMTLDMIIVEDIKEKKVVWVKNNKSKNQDPINASRVTKRQGKKIYEQVYNIVNFLKSFFHKCETNIQIRVPNSAIVMLIQKLFQYTSGRKSNEFLELKKMLSNLSANSSFEKQICSYLIDPKNSFLIDLTLNCSKSESFNPLFKNSIDALTIFSIHTEVRAIIYRNKLIQDLNSKILKHWEKLKDWDTNIPFFNEIILFYLSLSMHKDSHTKIITDKKIFEILVELTQELEIKPFNCNAIMLLTNLAYSKHNKSMFVANKELHKTILTIITNPRMSLMHKKYMMQLLYNLLYKCSAAIRLYKKKQVVEQLRIVRKQLKGADGDTMNLILEILESDYN